MTGDLLVTFGTVIAFGSIMFFTIVFVVHGVTGSDDGFPAFRALFSSQLKFRKELKVFLFFREIATLVLILARKAF